MPTYSTVAFSFLTSACLPTQLRPHIPLRPFPHFPSLPLLVLISAFLCVYNSVCSVTLLVWTFSLMYHDPLCQHAPNISLLFCKPILL